MAENKCTNDAINHKYFKVPLNFEVGVPKVGVGTPEFSYCPDFFALKHFTDPIYQIKTSPA